MPTLPQILSKLPNARLGAVAGLVGLLVVLGGGPARADRPHAGDTSRPDIVLIVTDDQRWDTLWAMPSVQSLLVNEGVTFSNAFAVNPSCCPSRASILTGTYSHTNGVWRNSPPYGGFESFQDGSTVATWLQDAGYRTGLIGKYFNGYENTSYVPPGWDRWVAFTDKTYAYYDYTLSVDGAPRALGWSDRHYSTDRLGRFAYRYIDRTPAEEPLFLYFAPNAPHGSGSGPPKVASRHSGSFEDLALWRPPSWYEPDLSDKPAYIREHQEIIRDRFRKRQYESLLAVDDAVKDIVTSLEETGRLDNTMIVFTSDNGMLWGEHGWRGKHVPYEESIRLPLVVRFDPALEDTDDDRLGSRPRRSRHLVNTTDLAPTIGEAAGVATPGAEGLSLMPLLAGEDPRWRRSLLFEHLGRPSQEDSPPTYCGLRTKRYSYIAYETGERELYSIKEDPYQLFNLAGLGLEPLEALDATLREECDPPPPGFVWP